MALKYLNNEEMLQISGTWVDPGSEANKAILGIPDLSAFLPRVSGVHAELAALLQPSPTAQVVALIAEEAAIDIRHDHIIRSAHGLLTAMAELVGGEAGQEFVALRDHIAPEGPMSTQKSYRAEATQAAQLKDRISSDIKAKLDGILVGAGSQAKPLTHYIEEWIALGKKLGDLEDKKARLIDAPEESTAMATLKARNLWIRTVNAFLAVAELAELDVANDRLVFGPLRVAEKAAVRRHKARGASDEATDTPGTTDTPTPETPAPVPNDR